MTRMLACILGLCSAMLIAVPGCSFLKERNLFGTEENLQHYETAALHIEYPNVESPIAHDVLAAPPPITIDDETPEYWDLTLEEVMKLAMANSRVMKDLGGFVLRSPDNLNTIYGPAIQESDPRFGTEAALSAFDASFATSAFFENNDRALNNTFFGGGTRILQQDAGTFQAQISKLAATGTRFTLRNETIYDANNAPGNTFPSAWNSNVDAEFRHPFLLGGGVDFNRIAGPSRIPGVYNGILVARTNTDISLADFELAVRNFASDVENAYWDLYFAYRDLDAKIKARDAALETWRNIRATYVTQRKGAEAEREAQARAQYYLFKEQVQNALTGRLLERTRTNNGSTGGTFRSIGGVHVAERRLRWLMGLTITDGRLIRPADEPLRAEIVFDWETMLAESLMRRVELRRQKWKIKRREMELIASQKFQLPTLDAVGRYRWRGFGDDLLDPDGGRGGRFDNALGNLTSGDFQEWQLGVELAFPFGFRRAHAAVRNAEFQLAQEREILAEQERQTVHDLSNALAEMHRAHTVLKTSYNAYIAARQELEAQTAAYEVAERTTLDQVLDAQRRLANAESRYYQALVEYHLAVKNVHLEKGSLLSYNGIQLSEGPWPHKAYHDAAERANRRTQPLDVGEFLSRPPKLSRGEYPQRIHTQPQFQHSEIPHSAVPPMPASADTHRDPFSEVLPASFAKPSGDEPMGNSAQHRAFPEEDNSSPGFLGETGRRRQAGFQEASAIQPEILPPQLLPVEELNSSPLERD